MVLRIPASSRRIVVALGAAAGLALVLGRGARAEPPAPCPPHAPPPEAFAACDGKASGDACSVKLPGHDELAGTCGAMPGGDRLVCIPKNHMPPPRSGRR